MPDRTDDDSERRQAEDQIALESGGLPQSVRDRLIAQTGNRTMFSSTFSVKEFLSARSVGMEPLGQVMGTAFITMPRDQNELNQYANQLRSNPSYRPIYSSGSTIDYQRIGSMPVNGELSAITYGRLQARQLAITRMTQEAELLNSTGVIAVRAQKRMHDWGGGRTLEFTVMGTAVRIAEMKRSSPFTSLLSGQEFCQLWQAGFEPTGIALGVCSYTDCTDTTSIYGRNYNQEVAAYTSCFYEARKTAMDSFKNDLRQHRATGAIGIEVDYEFEDAESEAEVSEGVEAKFLHLITHFAIMGTAIKRRASFPNTPRSRPRIVYNLRKAGAAEVDFAEKGPMK